MFVATGDEITLNSLSDIGLMNGAASLKILLNPKSSLEDNKNDIFSEPPRISSFFVVLFPFSWCGFSSLGT
jgi:hypothetical protein